MIEGTWWADVGTLKWENMEKQNKSHEIVIKKINKKEIEKNTFYGKIKLLTILRKKVFFMYFNTQEEIITKIAKSLEKSLILRKKVIKILASIVIGMILAKSTIVSKIAENLKEDFCDGEIVYKEIGV